MDYIHYRASDGTRTRNPADNSAALTIEIPTLLLPFISPVV